MAAAGRPQPGQGEVGPALSVGRRERFRQWRHARPFWGCALTLLFAVELYAATAAPMRLILVQGVTALGTLMLSATLLVLALATLAQPLLRTAAGPLVVLLALGSLLVSNFGGFLVGMALGLIGGGMIFAWSPTKNVPVGAAPPGGTGPAEPSEPGPVEPTDRHRPTLLAVALLLPMAGVALPMAPPAAAPAAARTATGAPADFPCLIALLCPTASPTPTPKPSAIPTLPARASCKPTDYPTSDGTPVGDVAALAARVLQACAKAGKANPGTAKEVAKVGIRPSLLKTDRLTLEGLTYRNTVRLTTANGALTVMEFSATKLTVVGLDLAMLSNTQTVRLTGTRGTTTISGHVRLYASDLSGKAFDLLPVRFTANPPPLLPPFALPTLFLTGATSHVALVTADSIRTSIAIAVD